MISNFSCSYLVVLIYIYMKQPNQLALAFANELSSIQLSDQQKQKGLHDANRSGEEDTLHVQETGAALTELYESIRNASQNAQENLLLMHAIARFIDKYFWVSNNSALKRCGEDLIIELTLAGYLQNDSISLTTIDIITKRIHSAVKLKGRLTDKYNRAQIERWVIKPLSAAIENQLRDHREQLSLADVAYNYFLTAIDKEKIGESDKLVNYEATLFVATQKALLKLAEEAIRLNMMERYQISPTATTAYANFNQQLDGIFESDLHDKLVRIIDRNGAPFRILGRTMVDDDGLSQHLLEEKTFLGPFTAAINKTYLDVNREVNRGIIRSVVFLIITKFIIGIAAEVPYDLAVHGEVVWIALCVNLLLPPLYMVLLRATLMMPDQRNTKALTREMTRILYSPIPKRPFITGNRRHFSKAYNFLYFLVVVGVFSGVAWLLIKFARFEWIHLIIFFVFISTASFLGFRLSRRIREIEVGEEAQTTATVIRDFLYMPFVAVGRYISETYSKVNIVSRLLDMFVELPMKTIIAFFRRWGNFMSAKRDEL